MYVGFVVTSYWAYGELLIAIEFAKRITSGGYKPYFLIPPSHEKIIKTYGIPYTLLIPKAGNVNRILFKDFEERYRPTHIILADFINYCFCERHYGLTVDDLNIFSGRIGTFDDFDWEIEKRPMDTYGYKAKTVSEINIENFGFKLAPCPIVNPLNIDRENKNMFHYPLLEGCLEYDSSVKQRLRNELALPKDKKIILLTSAVWQETHKLYPHVTGFVEASNYVFRQILKRVAYKDCMILYVGPQGFLEESENVRILNQLPPYMFDKYAMASDLFLSRNITSSSLAKLALSGIPCAVLKNSLNFKPDTKECFNPSFELEAEVSEKLQKLDICYPYRMYPVGWHRFLKPVLKGNPYMDVIADLEQFDVYGTVDKLSNILWDEDSQDRFINKAAGYRKHLENLYTPAEALEITRVGGKNG